MQAREKLAFYRKRAKLTQEQLAERAGTSRSVIVKLERGERQISAKWRELLAPHLGLEADDLLSTADEETLARLQTDERDLIETYRQLSPEQRTAFRTFLKASKPAG